MKIHHFAIEVSNIEVSIDFYVNILGFVIKAPKRTSSDGEYSYVNIDLFGTELELIEYHKLKINKINKAKITPHLGIESFDIEKDILTLKKNNIKIIDGPHKIINDVIKLTILDPDGYRIDIGQLI